MLPFASVYLFSQGGSAAPFLYINPSPVNNAIGGAGIAVPGADPLSIYDNSAILGYNAKDNNIAIEFYPASVPINIFNSAYSAFGFYLGYNNKKDSNSLPLSIGAGFYRTSADLGEFVRTDATGRVIGTFSSVESANNFAFGAMLDYWLQIGFGFTYKMVFSDLEGSTLLIPAEGKGHVFDVGLLLNAPVVKSLKISNVMDWDLDIGFGLNITNFGSELEYEYESDPFNTSSNIGYSVRTGLDWEVFNSKFNAIDLIWSVQCDNFLLVRDSLGSGYNAPYSGFRPIDNMLLLNSSGGMLVKYGTMIKLMDIGCIGFGGISDPWMENTTSFGFGIRSEGILKIINSFANSSLLKYMADHIDITYYNTDTEQSERGSSRNYSSLGIRFHDYIY